MFNFSLRVSFIIGTFVLCACAGPQGSVKTHARHASYQLAQAHFDPNTRSAISDNNQRLVAFFEQFYQAGKSDKACGVSREQAEKRIAGFRHPDFMPISEQKSTFINQVYSSDIPKQQRDILIDNGIATYWDGYEGRL
ncbi:MULTISPECIES: Exc2 family lipoprotein [Serratia]|uniref:Exc2 family lipoprotein n=1 Tax=Serratia TaxID=613 RepID=UPI00277A9E2C|nr:Exc2 family lipoprotein [Serratia marcescens]MDP8622960.1 Exc2 family lipoprotein [Serratia marcescens]